jgi:CRISPR-associated protein Csm2
MNGQRPSTSSLPSEQEVRKLIINDEPEDLVKWADQTGQRIARQITTSQIRNIFGTVRQIEMNWRTDAAASYRQAVLLKPKLGYAAARERGQGMKDLEAVLRPGLDAMMEGKTPEERHIRFKRFAEFFEAVLAYHKKYGGN